jgi:hypothetical protein
MTMSVKEVMEIATAASASDSASLRGTFRSGFVRCQDAVIRNASSIPTPAGILYNIFLGKLILTMRIPGIYLRKFGKLIVRTCEF